MLGKNPLARTKLNMRLTLKTILAYSDDLFDAEYRPAIEKRISEDDASGYLLERMRSAVRNPDIPVPGRYNEKEELSANLVAAYLDNLLSDVELSRFETICLRSDIYLAEIACSHQILTTILGRPAKLNRDCRLRLYAIPRHQKIQAAIHPTRFENQDLQAPELQADMKIEPESRKKRRITVTAQDNSVSHPIPSREMPSEYDTPSADTEPSYGSAEPTTRIAVGPISRLGQAFAQRKRHRSIMIVFSLTLLFLCVSAFLLAHLKPKHTDNDVAHHNPPVMVSTLLTPDGEITNTRRLDDSKHFWKQSDIPSASAMNRVPSMTETELVARNDAIYSINESPDRVMAYLPGQNGVPSQVSHPAGIEPGHPLPSSSLQANVPLPPAATQGFHGEAPPILQPSPARQNPLHQPGFQTTVNISNTPIENMSIPGNAMTNDSSGVQHMTVRQDSVLSSPPQTRATIQLIDDHGNVPRIDRINSSSLPAVQPATWGMGDRPGNSGENPSAGSNHQSAFPQGNWSIEQVSYTPDPGQPGMPPLMEPNWNATNHGGFEQIVGMPQIPTNSTTSPPLRLPDNTASSDNATSPRFLHLVSNENIAVSNMSLLVLGMEDLALIRETPETEWSWLPVSKQLAYDIVLIPAPFRAALMFPNGITVETEGDTRVQILPDDEAGHPTLAFDCGHLIIYATASRQASEISKSLRIVTPVGGGVLRFTDTNSHVVINSENKTTVKLLKVSRPYESVTTNPLLSRGIHDNNVVYCPNLMSFPAEGKTIYWQKDGNSVEWNLATASIFPIDIEKNINPILLYNTSNVIVAPAVVWPALVSHDGRIPISKLDLKNQFVTMPHTFYPTPSKTWLLK